MHECYWICIYIFWYSFHGFCILFAASQNLVACSTEEYKAPGQPGQEVFQDGSGKTWDRCTVTGLFSSEVNYWSCDCSVALSPARQLHVQRVLCTHGVDCILHPLQSHLYQCDQRIDLIVSGGRFSHGIHRNAKCCCYDWACSFPMCDDKLCDVLISQSLSVDSHGEFQRQGFTSPG